MLTQIQINTLNALLSAMDKDELDEALDLLLDEVVKRDINLWIDEINPPVESPGMTNDLKSKLKQLAYSHNGRLVP